jgi:hypothetical protein
MCAMSLVHEQPNGVGKGTRDVNPLGQPAYSDAKADEDHRLLETP